MGERIDTSEWPEWILVKTEDLRVESVEHEVVEWDASFCSEDTAIPLPKLQLLIEEWRIASVGADSLKIEHEIFMMILQAVTRRGAPYDQFPLPEPWRPMSELPDNHPQVVLIAYLSGDVVPGKWTRRRHDRDPVRVAWRPLPEHPFKEEADRG